MSFRKIQPGAFALDGNDMPPPTPNIKVMPTKNKPNTKPTKHACILHPGCAATLCQQHFVYTRVDKIAFREFHQAHKKYRAYAHVVTFRPAHRFCWSHTRGAAAMPSHLARRTRDLNERPPLTSSAASCSVHRRACASAPVTNACVCVCVNARTKNEKRTQYKTREKIMLCN